MKFVTIEHDGADRVGILDHDVIRALDVGVTLLDLLGDDGARLREAGEAALRSADLVVSADVAKLRAPIPRPPTVRDYMTFERHFEGVSRIAGPQATVPPVWYEAPAFYFTNPNSVHGPNDDVAIPPGCNAFDLELEVAAVLGSGGRDLAPDDAEQRIAGFMLFNDWSARDLQVAEFALPLGPSKGKDSAFTLGPWFVTPDELSDKRQGDTYDIKLTARINGEVLGSDTLTSMSFSFGQMIAYASRGTDVHAGEVFASGTCGGGCLAEWWGRHGVETRPPLAVGDVVSIEAEGLGQQTTLIVAGARGIERAAFASTARNLAP